MTDFLRWMVPGRDSVLHTIGLGITLTAFVLAQFEAFSGAFGIAPIWEHRLQLISGLFSTAIGYFHMSPLPLSARGQMRVDRGLHPNGARRLKLRFTR